MQNQHAAPSPVQLSPMQWSVLPDITDVPPMSLDDHAVLDAVRDVLVQHGALGRFGVHLLHKHFDVAEDEVLVEYTDVNARTQECRVEKRVSDRVEPSARIETMWSFSGPGALRVCDQQCVNNYGHNSRHYQR
jgi:hypothetical protein